MKVGTCNRPVSVHLPGALCSIKSIQSSECHSIQSDVKLQYHNEGNPFNFTGWAHLKWPSGASYQGSQVEGKCHGKGEYAWPDGSRYTGSFISNCRHGHGEMNWPSGERYVGDFLHDNRDGTGVYTWSDGSKYHGGFKDNKKSGFGKFVAANGDEFQGMYLDDMRCGPGILSYKDSNSQDIGFWKGKRLIRICSIASNAFLYESFFDHSINPGENVPPNVRVAVESRLSNPPELRKVESKKCDAVYSALPSPTCFVFEKIVNGVRPSFGEKGPLEVASESLLTSASTGYLDAVCEILRSDLVHVDVADKTGYTSVLAAAVNCHFDVLNVLLDHGADVNAVNDDGLSALTACHILLYARCVYVDNIAERLPRESAFNAVEVDKRTGYVVNRNDKKAITQMYEQVFHHLHAEQVPVVQKASSSRKESVESAKPRPVKEAKTCESLPERDTCSRAFDAWKIALYQESVEHVKKVEAINRSFLRHEGWTPLVEHALTLNETRPRYGSVISELADACDMSSYGSPVKGTVFEFPVVADSVIGCYGDSDQAGLMGTPVRNESAAKLINEQRKPHLLRMIQLLLKRGASPNSSTLPMAPIFFAVKSADPVNVRLLLEKKAVTSVRLSKKSFLLCPLHIAAALPCEQGIQITNLLLEFGADPNLRDGYYGDVQDGRTALHIAAAREDNDQLAAQVVRLLLKFKADPDLTCQGNSALSLAVSSGNDLVIDALLEFHANPSLKLSHGVGSALCAAVCFQAERRRSPAERIKLINKLVRAGADMLTPVRTWDKLSPGTVVDYAYHVFLQDRRIASTPYHALTSVERECHAARKGLLDHLAGLLRVAALKKEKQYLDNELARISNCSPDELLRAEAEETARRMAATRMRRQSIFPRGGRDNVRDTDCGLAFMTVCPCEGSDRVMSYEALLEVKRMQARKRLRYCYECGRSTGVRLMACGRCGEVLFCSKVCKAKSWNARHREECLKVVESSRKLASALRKEPRRERSRREGLGSISVTSQACHTNQAILPQI